MSHPRQPTPSQSPTPSKSSLRQISGTQNPSQRSLIPPPSPRFDDQPAVPVRYSPRSPPNQTLEYESDEDDEPLIYPDAPPVDGAGPDDNLYFSYPEPERPFQPFFTLIEDGLTSEHHHPSVHYIFADDDAEIITEAALRSLEQDLDRTSSSTADANTSRERDDPSTSSDTRLPPLNPTIREHYLILDVYPTPPNTLQSHSQSQSQQQPSHSRSHSHSHSHSQLTSTLQPPSPPPYTISRTISLSPTWQITRATISSAPTIIGTLGSDETLMLRFEGRGVPTLDEGEIGRGEDREKESLEQMIERFRGRLGEVKRLIEEGEGSDGPRGGSGGIGRGDGEVYEGVLGLEEQD